MRYGLYSFGFFLGLLIVSCSRKEQEPKAVRINTLLQSYVNIVLIFGGLFPTALIFPYNLGLTKAMKQTVTIEIADNTVLPLLRSLASMNLIKLTPEIPSQDDLITARLNEIYDKVDSSLDPCYVMAQVEVLESEDW